MPPLAPARRARRGSHCSSSQRSWSRSASYQSGCSGVGMAARRSGGGDLVVLELVAQVLLGELADARLRDLVDEDHVVGQPPLGHTAVEELEDVLLGQLL